MNIHLAQALSALAYFKEAPNFLSNSSDLKDSLVFNVDTWLRDTRRSWRPLEVDVDAFSLMVKLGLEPHYRADAIYVTKWDFQTNSELILGTYQNVERRSSTRQALVLAAAEDYLQENQVSPELCVELRVI